MSHLTPRRHVPNQYTQSRTTLSKLPLPASPEPTDDDYEKFDDALSEVSSSSWKSGEKSSYSSYASSLNNNAPMTRATTAISFHKPLLSCSSQIQGNPFSSPIQKFYEDDELCRNSIIGRLEFGIVSKQGDKLRILWTLGKNIEEQEIEDDEEHENLCLIDRKASPGDIIFVNKKKGEVTEVSWICHVQILENKISLLNIPCDSLQPLLPHYVGQKIEYTGWVGTVVNVATEATLMFTGYGKTGVVDCSVLPIRSQPYPGRRVRYSVNQYIEAKLRFLDDTRSVTQVFTDQIVVEAFVLFLNVTNVEIKWNGKIRSSSGTTGRPSGILLSPSQPPTTLTKTNLKKYAKVLGTVQDVDWEQCHDAVERYFQYAVKDTDIAIPDGGFDGIEEYFRARYFDGKPDNECATFTVKKLKDKGTKICTNVAYNVKVLRFSRVLKVKWNTSGKIENIPASMVTYKHSFPEPYHQIVQKSLTLAPYSYDEYGVTLSRNLNDTVLVQWMGKSRDPNANPESKSAFMPLYQTPEPLYNLQPHFAYSGISPREIVYRSVYCCIPEQMFTVGWVRSITNLGTVIVVSAQTKQEHSMYPLEIEASGMKIDHIDAENDKFKVSRYTDLVKLHGLNLLRNAEKLFIQNLAIQEESSSFPNHFTLLQKCPTTHIFYKNTFSVKSDGSWIQAVKRDQLFLTTRMNIEIGTIWIKGFRDRLDLFSVMMAAPAGTPYEGSVFTLELQIIPEYPCSPPSIYLHTAAGQLRPGIQNLELQDNVKPPHSLVGSLIALQAKLFTFQDPFEIPSSAASLARRSVLSKDSEDRLVNARVIIDVLDLQFRLVMDPPKPWMTEVVNYFLMTFERTKERLMGMLEMTNPYSSSSDDWIIPTFPLLPVTDGFAEAVITRLKRFEYLIEKSAT